MNRWSATASLIAILLALAGCGAKAEKLTQLPAGEETATAVAAVAVETSAVTRQTITRPIVANGTTEPIREANLGPQMNARIDAIMVKEGDLVKAGTPLVRLDSIEAALRVQQTAASAASSQSQYELAKAELDRLAPLAERGTVTAQQLQRLVSTRDSLKAASEAAKLAEAQAERGVVNTTVRAPFTGVISKVQVEVGEVATMVPVTVLARLVDLSSVDVRVKVHERELSRIAIGNTVEAKFPSSNQSAQGQVTFISPEIDARTRNAEIVTRIPNPNGAFRAGMFAEISILPSGSQQSLVISTGAVGGTGDERYVYVANGELAERRKVRIASIDAERVEVLEGLKDGELIVNGGLGRLSDGSRITLATEAKKEPPAETAKAAPAEKPGVTP